MVTLFSPMGRFQHPFKPFLAAGYVTFLQGTVDTFTPKIGGKPIGDPNARLKLEPAKVNANGESWAVLEVEPNDQGTLDEKSRIEIVQLAAVNFHDEKIGRQPLVLILWNEQRPFRAIDIAYFNLRYERVKPAPGGGIIRHFFL